MILSVFVLMMVFFLSLIFVLLFYLLNFFLDVKFIGMNKVSVFESGFLSISKIQSSFSVQFFVIMLIFVVFDLEIVMFLGFLVSDSSSLIIFFFMILFVLLGFYMEWFFGKLLWIV